MARAVIPWRALLVGALLSTLAAGIVARGSLFQSGDSPSSSAAQTGLSSLPAAAQGPVSSVLGADRPAYRVSGSGGERFARNPAQRLSARFDRSGTALSTHALRLSLRAQALGFAGGSHAIDPVAPTAAANRVSYEHSAVSEWYANGPLGLEQGFTVARAPAGGSGGALTLRLAVGGNARAVLAPDAQSVTFHAGETSLRYGGLVATDASGRRLHSRLGLHGDSLMIVTDAHGARYPLRIDPLIQQGGKLTGAGEEGPGNQGASVAMSADGNTALVGAPGDEIKGKEMLVGAAWVFTRSGSTWTQQGPKLRAEDEENEGQFGISVALSADGDTALIGGITDVSEKSPFGAAWVFTRSGGKWSQQGDKLTVLSEESSGGRFGKSVALSDDGNTALIGAYFDAGQVGAAWVFTRSGSTWKRQGPKLTGEGEGGEGQFGFSVALSSDGNTALIGAPNDEGAGKKFMSGAAWVFTRSGATWTQQGSKLIPGDESGLGEFGTGVALSGNGDIGLIGGPSDGKAGAAWTFARSGTSWSQQGAKLTPGDASDTAAFGAGVALSDSGETALIGGPLDTSTATPSGAAWEFARNGSSWSQQAKLKAEGPVIEREFGVATALSSDGRTALVGAPLDDGDSGSAWPFANPVPAPAPQPIETPISPTTRPAPDAPLIRPVLSHVTQSHLRWRAGSRRARLSASRTRKPPVGTTFSFTLNVAASVKLTFLQTSLGRKVKGECVAQRRANRRKPICKRTSSPGALSFSAHTGSNKIAFQGVLGSAKKLKPGAYTLLLGASSGGRRASAQTLKFTVVR